jgi:hypothetical protein
MLGISSLTLRCLLVLSLIPAVYMVAATSDPVRGPDAPGRAGHPQIFEAIEDGDLDRVKRLIASGANLEARGYAQKTPILKAAMTHNWTMAEMLLAAGADPMVPDEFGITVTAVAARSRLRPESDEGLALDRVRAVLTERGLISLVFRPDQVREMVREGLWPPV